MNFEVLKRDCTARIGLLEINGRKIETPHILWFASERINPPDFASLFLSQTEKALSHSGNIFFPKREKGLSLPPFFIYPYAFPHSLHQITGKWNREHASSFQIVSGKATDKISSDPIVYILANARELFSNPREFVKSVVKIREKIGYHKVLYAPGLGEPFNIALLSYCTIDLFDSFSLIEKARKGIFLFSEGEYTCKEEIPCHCPACIKGKKTFDDVLFHNYYSLFDELQKVKNAIRRREMREFVERRICNMPKLLSFLHILDNEYHEFQERKYAVVGKKIHVSCLSFKRPDIERFRKRIQERYIKPASAKILLLLPCSAKKPYSFSKSHVLFRRAVRACRNPHVIHEVIVTSPLGIVPRELETLYPAAHYDISVTGHWSHDEKEMVKNCFFSYLHKNRYDIILNHLPSEIADFIEIGERTCIDHPISTSSLSLLSKKLQEEAKNFSFVDPPKRKYEDALSTLSYQFGEKTASLLLHECEVRGKYPYYKIFYEKTQIATTSQRGLFSLTMEGGERLASAEQHVVEIDDFVPRGTIFAVGINDADEEIREGDDVAICHGEDIRAVGVALMDGEEMVESKKGKAIRVRHYKG